MCPHAPKVSAIREGQASESRLSLYYDSFLKNAYGFHFMTYDDLAYFSKLLFFVIKDACKE